MDITINNKKIKELQLTEVARYIPLGAQYWVVFPEMGHWVHVEALLDYQEAWTVYHPAIDVNSYSPYYLEQHGGYSLDQSTHSTRAVASCHQLPFQVQLLSALYKIYQQKRYSV